MSSLHTAPRKTLWEEGRHPGRLVRTVAVAALLATAFIDVLLFDQLSLLFDAVFVLLSVGAALAVRPRDFFVVGVLPPLMMFGAVLLLAVVSRDLVAEPTDGLVQAVVSGLAHHAGALVTGYLLTLVVLWVRQTALRNAGAIRAGARRATASGRSRGRARRRRSSASFSRGGDRRAARRGEATGAAGVGQPVPTQRAVAEDHGAHAHG